MLFLSVSSISLIGTGCSTGASAPPVSLPAPVTGRLTVTSPDQDTGAALVSGDQGSVSGGSIVHAVNETQAGTSALLLLSSLFPSAMAQTAFPDVCSRPFHVCARAQDDGSFEVDIPAAVSDQIGVEILDPNAGTPISPRDHHAVPQNVRHFIRGVVDVGILPSQNRIYALVHGIPATSTPGIVSIVDLNTNTRTPITFDGFDPQRLVLNANANLAAIIDANTSLVDFVDLTTNAFGAPITKFAAPAAATGAIPTDVAFSTDGTHAIASYISDQMGLAVIDPLTGTMTDFLGNDKFSGTGFTNRRVNAVTVGRLTSPAVDVFAFVGLLNSGSATPTPFVALGELGTGGTIVPLSLPTPLQAGAAPHGVGLFISGTQTALLVTDGGNDRIWAYNINLDFTATPPTPVATLSLLGSVADSGGNIVKPDRIVMDPVDRLAYVNVHNGNDLHPADVLTIDLPTLAVIDENPVGHLPTGIDWDPMHQVVYVSTLGTQSVTFWNLAQLRP